MVNTKKLALTTVPALLAIPAFSSAQMVENPWQIKLGASRWSSSNVRDFTNETALSFGLGYQLPNRGLMGPNSRSFVEADWLQSNSDGNRVTSVGFWYVERAPFSPPMAGQKGMFYGGLGVGLAFNSARARGTGTTGGGSSGGGGGSQAAFLSLENGTNTETFNSTRLGFMALVGYEFDNNLFVEAQWRFSGTIEGANTDSLGLMIGFRF